MFKIYYTVLKCCASLCAGGMSARAAREKMYVHGSALLAKSNSYSRLFHESDHSIGSRVEKSGELDADIKPKGKKNILEYYSTICIFIFGWERHKHCGMSSI
jgi:hypothetical protein